jgi:hypothetical protein
MSAFLCSKTNNFCEAPPLCTRCKASPAVPDPLECPKGGDHDYEPDTMMEYFRCEKCGQRPPKRSEPAAPKQEEPKVCYCHFVGDHEPMVKMSAYDQLQVERDMWKRKYSKEAAFLPECPKYVAHPQAVWFHEHWRPIFIHLQAELQKVREENERIREVDYFSIRCKSAEAEVSRLTRLINHITKEQSVPDFEMHVQAARMQVPQK